MEIVMIALILFTERAEEILDNKYPLWVSAIIGASGVLLGFSKQLFEFISNLVKTKAEREAIKEEHDRDIASSEVMKVREEHEIELTTLKEEHKLEIAKLELEIEELEESVRLMAKKNEESHKLGREERRLRESIEQRLASLVVVLELVDAYLQQVQPDSEVGKLLMNNLQKHINSGMGNVTPA